MIKLSALVFIIVLSGLSGHAVWGQGTGPAASAGSAVIDDQAALREFAAVAVRRAADRLGHDGGFYQTPEFHIPLPPTLDKATNMLDASFAPALPIAVERAINRAAEDTAEPAGAFLLNALPALTFADRKEFLNGPRDAVTAVLRTRIGPAFRAAMRPMIADSLAKNGGSAALAQMVARFEQLANAPFPQFDIEAYSLNSFVTAFFACVAREEENIRVRPSERTTATLQRLFLER